MRGSKEPERLEDAKLRDKLYNYLYDELNVKTTLNQRSKLRSIMRELNLEWLDERNDKLQKEVIHLKRKEKEQV
jgi:hypothetical protein